MPKSEREFDLTVEPPDLLPWNRSFEDFFPLEDLERIRDDHPDQIIEDCRNASAEVKWQVVVELVEHGNYRKAAFLARFYLGEMDKNDRVIAKSKTDPIVMNDLLHEKLLELPQKPDEFIRFFAKKEFSAELLVDI